MDSCGWHEQRQVAMLDTAPLSSVSFDPFEEIVWIGNNNGRVASLVVQPDSLRRYTSFKAHSGPVSKLLVCDSGVVSLGTDSLRFTARSGIQKWKLSFDLGQQLLSMCFSNQYSSELIASTVSSQLRLINTARGAVVKQFEVDSEVKVIRRSRFICCGTVGGRAMLLDPRTYRTEHTLDAHTGALTDMDVNGNNLVTCGYSLRGGTLIVDPLVRVFDIRTMKSLPPIPFQNGPAILQFHPKLSSTILTGSQTGQFQICDIETPNSHIEFLQVHTDGYTSVADISSSGEMMAFGSSTGILHQWAEREAPKSNLYSRPFAVPFDPPPPSVHISEDSPLSMVGMPYYTSQLLSASWPVNMTFHVGQPLPKIPPEILANVKKSDFVGYAQNPKTFRRNQALSLLSTNYSQDEDVPRFRSEQSRYSSGGRLGGGTMGSLQRQRLRTSDSDDLVQGSESDSMSYGSHQAHSGAPHIIPKFYRKVEIKYSRFGVEDFDFGFYNETCYGGLETHIKNSYCNPMLQVLFFNPPLREAVKSHLRKNAFRACSCPKEFCLGCELAFLFQMLEDSKGMNCQASNFLRAFSTNTQASALGLFEPEDAKVTVSYSALIQSFNRFILEQLQQDLLGDVPPAPSEEPQQWLLDRDYTSATCPSMIQQIYGLCLQSTSTCQCASTVSREISPFVIDLIYPKKPSKPSNAPVAEVSPKLQGCTKRPQSLFCEILQSSLHREALTKAWCDNCGKYQSTTQSKHLKSLPNFINVNANATADEELAIWREDISVVPLRIALVLTGTGLTVVQLAKDSVEIPAEYEDVIQQATEIAIYDLHACVVEVLQANAPHLVAQIRVSKPVDELDDAAQRYQWYLFNDFLVQPLSESEVVQSRKWKVPAVLNYARIDMAEVFRPETLPTELDIDILFEEKPANRRSDLSIFSSPLRPDEVPTEPGLIVAIDAEFVALSNEETEIRSDGTRSVLRPSRLGLARVSVLRGDGECTPFIDDYIVTTEPVVDYLTEFSGIKAGDLDPTTSTHPLVPLKMAYRKLRLLVDLGCIFVGHGLKKDFRIINIMVPPEQVIDTVDIYWIKSRHRKLSLRFLAWVLLKQDIQGESHDSIEDAHTALLLYRKYQQWSGEGVFERVLESVYEEGRSYNFKVPSSVPAGLSLSYRRTPPIPDSGSRPASSGVTPVPEEEDVATQSWTKPSESRLRDGKKMSKGELREAKSSESLGVAYGEIPPNSPGNQSHALKGQRIAASNGEDAEEV
ncbi:ubiquitin carboxyl-terminal hydrolase-domain-containing protein [Polychytrium aggregatum]|uniref:ubiquitin carboxyl-terminal hydrolase-domain-containing protein n=1 Tax=Polychytrium aggregatum TaxID=110093 RepID=UPI0022FDCAEE|nr:ubiquitin carboxyl-terminal hydrolase-domain-containing protein [Polychytrium aggregatum]KAI9199852.1 ubiquitin carboxyl-terminal hydrolase-domain-containing protein [Polychytrium aggregatum]